MTASCTGFALPLAPQCCRCGEAGNMGPSLGRHHGLSCFAVISTARYSAVPIHLARSILGARRPKHCPDGLGFAEASRNVDGGAIGQRHYRTGTGTIRRRHTSSSGTMAIKAGKEASDARVERSLYQRANGYSHPAVKAFMTRDGKIVEHHYIEHYPPDPTSMIWWLKNRRPDRWRLLDVTTCRHPSKTSHGIRAGG